MADELPGEEISLWVKTTGRTSYPSLGEDTKHYDVVVVGGGITGIVAAYRLAQSGREVALIERERIVEWTTGGTTAKLSSQHYLIYSHLIDRHGEALARAFADANQDGIDAIERLAADLPIECEFSRRSSYVFSRDSASVEAFEREVEAARRLGLPAQFETSTELPFEVRAVVRFDDQAQFHPRKFLLKLAEEFVRGGGVIFEHTNATTIVPGEPNTVFTDRGSLTGDVVVQASGEPFWRNEILDGRMWMKMSYALAVELEDRAEYPDGMYITTDEPMRSIRSAACDGGPVLIFGGESHEYEEGSFDPDPHYRALIEDVRARFEVRSVHCRWLAGDFMPYDRIPFIGPDPEHPSIYLATGYRAWGLAWAMSAAEGIRGYVDGAPADWIEHFSLERLEAPLRDEDRVRGIPNSGVEMRAQGD
ncbi:MAG: FAD-binding oxidoreductase [Actinobacteria bacterium]|nr:FAD-binding oxidoreductase [Actinomycetota bacterium]